MLLEFIATISAGAGAAGLTLAAQKLTRGALPKWVMPTAAGAAMLGFSIWNDYTWFARSVASNGGDQVIATTVDARQIWRPWTYLKPVTTRYIALDKAGAEIDGATVLTNMSLVARRENSAIIPAAFDCLLSRRADLIGVTRGPMAEMLAQAKWIMLDASDPVLRAACDEVRS